MPYPPKDGGSIAMNILTDGLIRCGNEVKVIAINTPKHFINEENIDLEYKKKTSFESVYIDTEIKIKDAVLNLFSSESYNISRFFSPEFEKRLIEIFSKQQFDVVHLETLWVTPYIDIIRKYSSAKIILRSQNVEFLIWERLAKANSNLIKKWYLNFLAKRLKTYELSLLDKYDGIATITYNDEVTFRQLGCKLPIITIPFGISLSGYFVDKSAMKFPSVFHIGAMDWRPNADGIKWFIENVWQEISINHLNVNLYLAGRNMPEWFKNLSVKNVVVLGEVKDSREFINSNSIMIVPLNSGGGMRVKIIEGMALGKTIISTLIGAEGIDYENGKNIIIADTKDEFIEALNKCISDKEYADYLGNNARLLVENKYDNIKICSELTDFYKTIISKN